MASSTNAKMDANTQVNCITKCNQPHTIYIHPTLLVPIMSKTSTCAAYPIPTNDRDDTNLIFGLHAIDNCNATSINHQDTCEAFTSGTSFSPHHHLVTVYNLNNITEVIEWSRVNTIHKTEHINNIIRVQDLAWQAYLTDVDNVTDGVLEYYYELYLDNVGNGKQFFPEFTNEFMRFVMGYEFDGMSSAVKSLMMSWSRNAIKV